MKDLFIVGMGLSARDLTAEQMKIIRSADILMGSRRLLQQFEAFAMEKTVITGRVDEVVAFIRNRREKSRIVVLASGDPLFFGIGARIVGDLDPEQVTVLPNVTSIAAAFARIKEPWNDAKIISLHGRDGRYKLLAALKRHGVVAVLTDARQSPQWLAGWLLGKALQGVKMAVFENLGAPEEAFGWYALEQAVGRSFAQPNVVVLKASGQGPKVDALTLGMADDAYHHQDGLITKSEVRAVALAKLRLKRGMTLWDLGAGSGSVGLEASVLLGHGRIIAVEQDGDRVVQIRQNARRYGVYNHEVIQARLPRGLEHLPPPNRIFIGGGGGNLAAIIEAAIPYLAPDGMIVANTVLLDNLTRAVSTMTGHGLATEVIQVQVSRSKTMPWSQRLEAQNPVWVIAGSRLPGIAATKDDA
ncbi:MAG: precorrin-6y C5,15-methyltransferase (decarboxylating) subunit CbiE [Desulfobacteraceae bacterium]